MSAVAEVLTGFNTVVLAFCVLMIYALVRRSATQASAPNSFEVDRVTFQTSVPGDLLETSTGEMFDPVPDTYDKTTTFGFFSSTCEPCLTAVPRFVQWHQHHPDSRAVAVVTGVGGHRDHLVAELQGQIATVFDDSDSDIVSRFGIRSFPAFITATGRTVVDATNTPPR